MTSFARLPNSKARHLFLDRHGLSCSTKGTGKKGDLQSVIDTLGFVQVDSVNTVARAQHMILFARRPSYRAENLDQLLASRGLFEHWTHDASVISMDHFPHWRLKFARDRENLAKRWTKDRRAGFEEKFAEILDQVAKGGPVCSGDVGAGEKRGSGGWWDWHPSKTALEYLWRSGELSVCHREGFRKFYDLTERVIPPEYLNARHNTENTIDWACNAALDKLGFATSGELSAFWDLISKAESKAWCTDALARGDVIEIEVEGHDGKLRRSFARPDVLETDPAEPLSRLRVMSPFDPALRDRHRAERLFGFHYRIEIFVPEPKRVYGYYVFPVMEGDRLIGRIDMKCHRDCGEMRVRAFWPETGQRMGKGRTKKLESELHRVARFAGSTKVLFAPDWIKG